MFDREAIKALSEAQSIAAAAEAVTSALAADAAVAMLPSDFTHHDLEKFLPTRRRARGSMKTSSITDFGTYVKSHKEEGASVFVAQDTMTATAVLNLGTPAAPGHADNTAVLALKATAAYTALSNIASGHPKSQRDVAEWLEDWANIVTAIDADEQPIHIKHAIAAVRAITIDAARKVESEERSLSATRSALEQVTASSKGQPLPALLSVELEPYMGLEPRTFAVRVGVLTTGDKQPQLVLRIVKAEQHAEEMALELAALVRTELGDVPATLGAYQAK